MGVFNCNCAGTDPPDKATDQNVDYLIEQGKILWEQRTDPASHNKAEHFIDLASNSLSVFADSEDKEVLRKLTSFSIERNF